MIRNQDYFPKFTPKKKRPIGALLIFKVGEKLSSAASVRSAASVAHVI